MALILLWILLLVYTGRAEDITDGISHEPQLVSDLVRAINSRPNLTWTAGVPTHLENLPVDVLRHRRLGRRCLPCSKLDRRTALNSVRSGQAERLLNVSTAPKPNLTIVPLPPAFDPRDLFSQYTGPSRAQGDFPACWAFGVVDSLADRTARASRQEYRALSALDLLTCGCAEGCGTCEYGYHHLGWKFVKETGVTYASCNPYFDDEDGPIPRKHHGRKNTPIHTLCPTVCESGEEFVRHRCEDVQVWPFADPEKVKEELWEHGPVSAQMTIDDDFMAYKSGIYMPENRPLTDDLCWHVVSLVGFGGTDDNPYWIARNSWGPGWGEDGFFKVGLGRAHIMSLVSFGYPKF